MFLIDGDSVIELMEQYADQFKIREKEIEGMIDENGEYIQDEIIDRLSNVFIDCPECESIVLDDEQYQCSTCGGGSQINILEWLKQNLNLI